MVRIFLLGRALSLSFKRAEEEEVLERSDAVLPCENTHQREDNVNDVSGVTNRSLVLGSPFLSRRTKKTIPALPLTTHRRFSTPRTLVTQDNELHTRFGRAGAPGKANFSLKARETHETRQYHHVQSILHRTLPASLHAPHWSRTCFDQTRHDPTTSTSLILPPPALRLFSLHACYRILLERNAEAKLKRPLPVEIAR